MAHKIDLSDKQLRQMGVKVPRRTTFSKEKIRSWALKVLASMSELTQEQRRRVLEHASKLNKV